MSAIGHAGPRNGNYGSGGYVTTPQCQRIDDFVRPKTWRLLMSLFGKLFGRKTQPRQRIRICVECGMPVAEHKDWCSILRTQREREQKSPAVAEAK